MDRSYVDKDAISQRSHGGRSLHTYTPRSHEDLLKSHQQLDAARKARLQNELQRLQSENDRLRQELDRAKHDLNNKDNQINLLNNELRNKAKTPTPSQSLHEQAYDPKPVYEVDGQPLTLDDLIRHFNGVISRHHDLLNQKNQQIRQLQDALNNQPKQRVPDRREAQTQSQRPTDSAALQQNLMNEFTNQLTLIRKEYEQVEFILTDRNNKLERLIEDLQKKLDSYAREIQNLRNELAARGGTQQPSESTIRLIRDKEKENDYLKEIITTLKGQRENNFTIVEDPQGVNEDLENEIKKIIESKKDAISKLSNMIIDIKKDNLASPNENPDMSAVEKDCQTMVTDLNNMNDKLNSILKKLKESPHPIQGAPVNKDELITNLENLKKQCQNEIDTLTNQISPTGDKSKPDSVIMRGQAILRIDDPNYLRKKPPMLSPESGEESQPAPPDEPIETVSNMKFTFYPSPQQPTERRIRKVDERPEIHETEQVQRPLTPQSSHKYIPTTPPEPQQYKQKMYPDNACEACSYEFIPTKKSAMQREPQPVPRTPSPIKKLKRPESPSKNKLIMEFYHPSNRALSRERGRKPKIKGGCCGKQTSEMSNAPYTRYPEEERLVHVHSPYNTPESSRRPRKMVLKRSDINNMTPSNTVIVNVSPDSDRHKM